MPATQQWWMAIGGHQIGPVMEEEIIANIRNGSVDGSTLVFTAGMANWTPLREVPQLSPYLAQGAGPNAPTALALPPPPGRRAHDIDFQINGTEMQFVEVELDPGESAVAEAGAFMYMTPGISMETVFGDGSQQGQGGVMGALMGAGKRLLTGESLFMTVFTNSGGGKQRVAFAAPYAGKIIPMDLASLGGELICQKDSFLCAARGVSIGIAFQRKIGAGLFGGEGSSCSACRGTASASCTPAERSTPLDLAAGRDAAGGHRLPRRAAAVGDVRHPVRRQDQDGALRRGRALLRDADRTRQGLAPVAAVQPAGGSHLQGRAASRQGAEGRGIDTRRLRRG